MTENVTIYALGKKNNYMHSLSLGKNYNGLWTKTDPCGTLHLTCCLSDGMLLYLTN